MAGIAVLGFQGEQPQVAPRLMPNAAAQEAQNARLTDGTLHGFRASVSVEHSGDTAIRTIYPFQGIWLTWNTHVHCVPGPVATDRLYITGDEEPKMRVGTDEDADIYPLAIDPPSAAPSLAPSGSGSGDVFTRIYCYTFVTDLGEESEPSPVSAEIDWQSGITITLSGLEAGDADRRVAKQRIYRSQSGQTGTYFYLIAERDTATDDFVDNIAVDAFAEPLPSMDYQAPPDDLEGITALPNGMMVAFVGKRLYFCEPYQPHAWPEKYVQTVRDTIVGLAAAGNSVIVLTEGQPTVFTGTMPEAMVETKIEVNLPCVSARSIADLGTVVVYSSPVGLVSISTAGVDIITKQIFERETWEKYQPEHIIGSQIDGRYCAFYQTENEAGQLVRGAMLFDVGGSPQLIRLSLNGLAAYYAADEARLYYLSADDGDIYQFDTPGSRRLTYYWHSKEFVFSTPVNMAAALVEARLAYEVDEIAISQAERDALIALNEAILAAGDGDGSICDNLINEFTIAGDNLHEVPPLLVVSGGTTELGAGQEFVINVYADGRLIKSTSAINRAFRLPSGFKAYRWEFSIAANIKVERVAIATTIDELKAAPA